MITVDDPRVAALDRLLALARQRGFVFTPAGERESQAPRCVVGHGWCAEFAQLVYLLNTNDNARQPGHRC